MRNRKIIKRGPYSYAIGLTLSDMKDFNLNDNSEVCIDDIHKVDENISNLMAKQKQPEIIKKIKGMIE